MTYRLMVVAAENGLLRDLVGQLGDSVQVQLFDSANEVLWEVRTNPPEALVAEVDLPGMTGIELAEILPNFEVPTRMVLYSPTDDAARSAAEATGIFRFLSGPISPAELREALDAAAQAAGEAAALQAAQPEPEPEPEPEPAPKPAARRMGMRAVSPAPGQAAPRRDREEAPRREEAPQGDAGGERRAFTPARVTLPSMRDRETPTPPTPPTPPAPTPSRGGLVARSKAAAARAPEPKAPPAPPAPSSDNDARGWRGTPGNLVITEKNVTAIKSVMGRLAQELGTQSVMLTDRAGMTLVEVGSAQNLPMMIVLPLLSTGFSTTGEVARQLREEDATSVYIHEGVNIDLYCFDVMQRFLLVLVFNKKVASSKIGAVWINAKRAIRELRDAFDK